MGTYFFKLLKRILLNLKSRYIFWNNFIVGVITSLFVFPNIVLALGVEAVNLEPVPLNNLVNCKTLLFRSSQHFKNTIFTLPKVIPGTGIFSSTGVETSRTFNVMTTDKPGIYDLAIFIFFPRDDDSYLSSNANSFTIDKSRCNWDEVLASLNEGIEGTESEIKVIADLPLTSLKMKIPGINDIGRIENFNSDHEYTALEYSGNSFSLHFQVTEKELNWFESNVVSRTGVNADLFLHFQARTRNGSVHVSINSDSILSKINSHEKIKNSKYISKFDLEQVLNMSFDKSSIQITGEAGDSNDIDSVVKQITDSILDQTNFNTDANKEISDTKSDNKNAVDNSNDESFIEVTAAISVIRKNLKKDFSYDMFSKPIVATGHKPLLLSTPNMSNPNISEVTVTANMLDPSSGMYVRKGETIVIAPAYYYTDDIIYNEHPKYLSTYDLRRLNLDPIAFPDLYNSQFIVKNKNVNWNIIAEGYFYPFSNLNSYIHSPEYVRWLRIQRVGQKIRKDSGLIGSSLDDLKQLPVYVTFSSIADRKLTQLHKLVGEHKFWTSAFDSENGQLYLTAKQDLGYMRFREKFKKAKELVKLKEQLNLDEIIEVHSPPYGKNKIRGRKIVNFDKHAPILVKSVVFSVTRPKILSGDELEYFNQLMKANQTVTIPTSN